MPNHETRTSQQKVGTANDQSFKLTDRSQRWNAEGLIFTDEHRSKKDTQYNEWCLRHRLVDLVEQWQSEVARAINLVNLHQVLYVFRGIVRFEIVREVGHAKGVIFFF